MFGGQGVLFDELMFALEAGGELYLKADETSVGAFRDAGSRQFFYMKEGRPMPLNFWTLPDQALDDPDEARPMGRARDRGGRARRGREVQEEEEARQAPRLGGRVRRFRLVAPEPSALASSQLGSGVKKRA